MQEEDIEEDVSALVLGELVEDIVEERGEVSDCRCCKSQTLAVSPGDRFVSACAKAGFEPPLVHTVKAKSEGCVQYKRNKWRLLDKLLLAMRPWVSSLLHRKIRRKCVIVTYNADTGERVETITLHSLYKLYRMTRLDGAA